MLYIASPVLITAGVKLLTAFIQFSHPLSSASDNYKFILLFYEFGVFFFFFFLNSTYEIIVCLCVTCFT